MNRYQVLSPGLALRWYETDKGRTIAETVHLRRGATVEVLGPSRLSGALLDIAYLFGRYTVFSSDFKIQAAPERGGEHTIRRFVAV